MVKTINPQEAVDNFLELLDEIVQEKNQYIIKSNGQSVAVIIPFGDYQRWVELRKSKEQAKKSFFEMVDELREYNKDVPYEQIEKDVAQAVAEVKQMELKEYENIKIVSPKEFVEILEKENRNL